MTLRDALTTVIGVALAVFGGAFLWFDVKDSTPSGIGAVVGGCLLVAGGVLIDPKKLATILATLREAWAGTRPPPTA